MSADYGIYEAYLGDLEETLKGLPLAQAERAAEIIFEAYVSHHAPFLFGNRAAPAPPNVKPMNRAAVVARPSRP